MIEPFCSVYTKSYRIHDREPEDEGTKPCLYYKDLGENFLPAEDSKTIYNPERDETVIKEFHLKRFVSTYQASYCFSEGKKSLVIDPNDLEADQFMVNFNNYYAKRTQAVLRPLETARRIHGYSRFENYYTGRTTYEDIISREAYNYFKKDYDQGKSRLYAKKQQEMKNKNKEVNPPEKEKENKLEEKPKQPENSFQVNENSKKMEKICGICCEKFGDFFSGPVAKSQQYDSENLNN